MFICEQVVLHARFPVACERFTKFVRDGWLHDASRKAHAEGLVGMTRVGPFGAVAGGSKLVRVHTLDPVAREGSLTLPMRWEATGVMGRLFPVFDADITLTPADADTTRLTLMGSYRPPFAAVGSGLDRLVLHRVADGTVRALLNHIAEGLDDPPGEPDPEPGAPAGREGSCLTTSGATEPMTLPSATPPA